MLPTFVIGLREGLEAALIVGIIAAFLRKQGRRDLLRWVWVGVGTAVLLCLAVGITLEVVSRDLPQRQQEGLETVVGVLAVGMVTYMVIWMRRHSRELKGQLEGMAGDAMAGHSRAGRAMVVMAFLAVLREGFETVVFLLAAFNEAGSGTAAAFGAVLGILVAVGLGYGIYRGGVRLNLSKFFRATGLVLVLVAAGLVVNALHTAHEAGWLNAGQGSTVDLTWLVRPGSVQASLLTGMLGVQDHPVVIEVVGWLLYLVPVGCYVAWPPGRAPRRRTVARLLLATAGATAALTLVLALVAPGRPAQRPTTSAGAVTARIVSGSGDRVVVRTQRQSPAGSGVGQPADIAVQRTSAELRHGLALDVYTTRLVSTAVAGRPGTLSYAAVAHLNGGRLPIGLKASAGVPATVSYSGSDVLTVTVEPRTGRIVDLSWREQVSVSVVDPDLGTIPLDAPIVDKTATLPVAIVSAEAEAAHSALDRLDRRRVLLDLSWTAGGLTVLLLLAGGAFAAGRRREDEPARVDTPDRALVRG